MNSEELKKLLSNVKDGTVEIEQAYKEIKALPYEDLGFAKLDHHKILEMVIQRLFIAKEKPTSKSLK